MSNGQQPRCDVVFEGWDAAEAIFSNTSSALRTGTDALVDLLTSMVERPDMVTLVISFGLQQSLTRRTTDPNSPYALERASDTVIAKTMQRSDGGIDVIIDGMPLIDVGGVEQRRRTVAHEAQHAVGRLRVRKLRAGRDLARASRLGATVQ